MRGAATDADDALRAAGEAALLAGHPDLRLQLQLNRINTRERTGIDDQESRWLHRLAARALMQRTDPSELATNTALVRLLAAALGGEEPDRIREAARLVGLGHDEDSARVAALIDALSEWDASLDVPGTLAMRAQLPLDGDDPAAIRQAWTTLAGLGTDAGYVLDQLWGQEPPPPRVLESLRAIYLWWGKDTGQPTTTGDAATQIHFLSEFPIDWSRPEMRSLDDLLLTAYPTMSDCLLLASRVGVNPAGLSSTRSVQATTRELLEAASRRGLLDVLVDTVLADPHAGSIHKPLRALLGDAWLSRHDSRVVVLAGGEAPGVPFVADSREEGTGYDPSFVGPHIAAPVGVDAADAVLVDGSPTVDYTHFSLELSKSRRLSRWVAWNIDGAALREVGDRDVPGESVEFAIDPPHRTRSTDWQTTSTPAAPWSAVASRDPATCHGVSTAKPSPPTAIPTL